MKKFFSLVLALVIIMSLVTVSAGAEAFTDDSSITYVEAVDVMSTVKRIDGYTDGSITTISLSKDYKAAGIAATDIVTYKANEGTYTLKEVTTTSGATSTDLTLKSGTAAITVTDPNTVYANSKSNVLFVAGKSASKLVVTSDADYYEYNAIVNGESTTVKVENTATDAADDANIYNIDEDGNITAISLKTIGRDGNDRCSSMVEDGQIVYLFIQEVAD